MDPRIAPLAELLRINRKLFSNCLDGLDEDQAMLRPAPDANSAAYVAAHMVESRYYRLASSAPSGKPLGDRVGWKSLIEITALPSLDEVKAAWGRRQRGARQAPARNDRRRPIHRSNPVSHRGPRHHSACSRFWCSTDKLHLGQLSLLRKTCGLPAMSYS